MSENIWGFESYTVKYIVSRSECLAYPSCGSPFYNLPIVLHLSDAIKRSLLVFYRYQAMITVTPFMNGCIEVSVTSSIDVLEPL